MVERILQFFSVACSHRKITQPFTASTARAANGDWEAVGTGPSHYVVCLECGKKFAYDWERMRIVR